MRAAAGVGIALLVGLVASDARAHWDGYPPITIHSGTICKNYNAPEVGDIDYLVSGTRNLNASPRYVICPLVRPWFNPTNVPTSRHVKISGSHSAYATTTCTVYLHGNHAQLYAARTLTFQGSSTWILDFTFTEAESPVYAKMSALCAIPGSGTGVITELTIYPYPGP